MKQQIEISIETLYKKTETAKLAHIAEYTQKALLGEDNDIILTAVGPVYLKKLPMPCMENQANLSFAQQCLKCGHF